MDIRLDEVDKDKALDRQIGQVRVPASSLLPKPLEPIGRQLGVEHRVLDIAVPEIMLDGTGIVTLIGELEPTRMAQHVRVDREGEGGERPGAGEYSPDRGGAQGPALLRDKYLGRARVVPLQASERPQLGAPQRMFPCDKDKNLYDTVGYLLFLGFM